METESINKQNFHFFRKWFFFFLGALWHVIANKEDKAVI